MIKINYSFLFLVLSRRDEIKQKVIKVFFQNAFVNMTSDLFFGQFFFFFFLFFNGMLRHSEGGEVIFSLQHFI